MARQFDVPNMAGFLEPATCATWCASHEAFPDEEIVSRCETIELDASQGAYLPGRPAQARLLRRAVPAGTLERRAQLQDRMQSACSTSVRRISRRARRNHPARPRCPARGATADRRTWCFQRPLPARLPRPPGPTTWKRTSKHAILREIEQFLLELGAGFTFVARQKRDADRQRRFLHRSAASTTASSGGWSAVELEAGRVPRPSTRARWSCTCAGSHGTSRSRARTLRLGIILCTGKKQEQIELLELDKSGIHVAEYLTVLPPREALQAKLHQSIVECPATPAASEQGRGRHVMPAPAQAQPRTERVTSHG